MSHNIRNAKGMYAKAPVEKAEPKLTTIMLKVVIEHSDLDNLKPLLEDALITAEEEDITKHPFDTQWFITNGRTDYIERPE